MMPARPLTAAKVVAIGLVAASAAVAGGIATAATPTTTVAPTTASPTTAAPTTAAPTTAAPTTAAPTTAAPTTAAPTTAAPTTAAPTTTAALTTTTVAAAAATTTVPPPAAIPAAAIRDAKVGWSRFVAANFATPNAILDPCPLLTVDSANSAVTGLGLVPTDLPFGVLLYRDATGAGIIGIVCGADLASAASPAGATLFAVEVTVLDGQAVFPQYVVRVAGTNTPIERAVPQLGGDMIGRCRNDAQFCVASWHSNGLVVTVKLDGPRTAESEAQVRQLLVLIAPQVLANLAAVTPNS